MTEFPTWYNHGFNKLDGTTSEHHCCGCWVINIDESDPLHPFVVCNECGEKRQLTPNS